MKILDHLISTLDFNASVKDIRQGVFHTAVTAPLSPILFDYGVDAVSGTQVVDSDVVLRCVSQGANFRQIRGVRRLTLLKR